MVLCIFSMVIPQILIAQNQRPSQKERLKAAIELYNKRLFSAAESEFVTLSQEYSTEPSVFKSEVDAYVVLCALELRRENTEGLVVAYETRYPESSDMEMIYFKFAGYYFDNQDYVKAHNYLVKLEKRNLAPQYEQEYKFKYAYCSLRLGNLDKAFKMFSEISSGKGSNFVPASKYYAAYILYMKKDFAAAVDIFKTLTSDKRFSVLSRYYILESEFMQKNYDYVIQNGEDIYNIVEKDYKSKTARMLSESYFAMKKPDQAKFYFEKYSIYSNDLSRKDLYYSGIIGYTLKSYFSAIDNFKKVITVNDSLSQNAYYHLANSYIQIKNKQEALNSFKKAADSNFDLTIKEDALFNYAKLSFDLNSDISVFDQYLKQYNAPVEKFNEIKNYIANSYLVKQDYVSALEALSQIKNPTATNIVSIQKASFLRGMQLIDLGAYREAIPFLETAVRNGAYNTQIDNLSNYWLAEAYYRNGQFQDAININLSLINRTTGFKNTPEYFISMFNLGYASFKAGQFEQAQQWFDKYIYSGKADAQTENEARVRLADSYFMQKRYKEASDSYAYISQKDLNTYFYASYQRAISLGLIGEDAKKIEVLKNVIREYPKSKVYPDFLYELGRSLVQTGDNGQAVTYFNELVHNHRESQFYYKALLELGLISINRHDVNKALEYYKRVVEENPMSQEAQDALAGMENIYQDIEKVQEYLAYLDKIGMSSLKSASEKEIMLFNAAEKQYVNGSYASASTSLLEFVQNYPQGSKTTHAYFYLGESYSKLGKPEAAMDAYSKVMERRDGSFTELATLHYAQLSYQIENYKQAYKAYSSLSLIAVLDNNKTEAAMGKMNSLFMDKQYDQALIEAKKASAYAINDNQKLRVKYITALSNYMTGNRTEALPILKDLAKNTGTPEGAESSYLLIANSFDNGDFASVERLVYAFSDTKTPHTYWLAKSFILLGDTYAEKEEWAQARATYNSILDSYKSKKGDDIVEQIRLRLKKIKSK